MLFGMKLADRSPGAVLAIAAAILCTQILIEIGMWMVSEPLAVVFAMVTAVAFSAYLIHWFHGLMSEDEPVVAQPARRRAATPSRVPLSPSMSARA